MPRGPEASRLRRRARRLLARLEIPEDALPGSRALSHRRWGKNSWHCFKGNGHPLWALTFIAGGKKRAAIPADWIDLIRPRVEAGRRVKQIAAALLRNPLLPPPRPALAGHPPRFRWLERELEIEYRPLTLNARQRKVHAVAGRRRASCGMPALWSRPTPPGHTPGFLFRALWTSARSSAALSVSCHYRCRPLLNVTGRRTWAWRGCCWVW